MANHEGVSCDSCMKSNFRGRRFKCLICYDYDLCGTCYERQATGQNHTADHAMQCILTRSDSELFFGGEGTIPDRPQSFACPYCRRIGFSEADLQEHLNVEHSDVTQEVVCPVCAAVPGGEPNRLTDHLATHLGLDHAHREAPQAAVAMQDESRAVRRPLQPQAMLGRGTTARTRRTNLSSGIAQITSREAMDPIAELLSQLGGIRRTGNAANMSSAMSHIQHFQQVARQVPRRAGVGETAGAAQPSTVAEMSYATAISSSQPSQQQQFDADSSRFLLPCLFEENKRKESAARQNDSDQRLFVQDVLLATLTDEFATLDVSGTAGQSMSKKTTEGDEKHHVTRIKMKATVPSQRQTQSASTTNGPTPTTTAAAANRPRQVATTVTSNNDLSTKVTPRPPAAVSNGASVDQLNGISLANGSHID